MDGSAPVSREVRMDDLLRSSVRLQQLLIIADRELRELGDGTDWGGERMKCSTGTYNIRTACHSTDQPATFASTSIIPRNVLLQRADKLAS